MSKLTRAKTAVRRRLESAMYRGGGHFCEGQEFLEHKCEGYREVNEVLVPKNVFQKIPDDDKAYFYHEINCSIECQWFHTAYGHSRDYREHHLKFVKACYGEEVVQDWIDNMPLKIRRVK